MKENKRNIEKLNLTVKNFGPISYSNLDLKPLTIFVGKNNMGKSYIAVLTYFIISYFKKFLLEKIEKIERGVSRKFKRVIWDIPDIFTSVRELRELIVESKSPNLIELLDRSDFLEDQKKIVRKKYEKFFETTVPIEMFNVEGDQKDFFLRETIIKDIQNAIISLIYDVEMNRNFIKEEIERLWSINLKDFLPRSGYKLEVIVELNKIRLKLIYDQKIDDLKLDLQFFTPEIFVRRRKTNTDYLEFWIYINDFHSASIGFRKEEIGLSKQIELIDFIERVIRNNIIESFKIAFCDESYYIPATRSGILQGFRALQSLYIKAAPFAGTRPIHVPPLPGIVSDFSFLINTIDITKTTQFEYLAEYLENKILQGKIKVKAQKGGIALEIFYELPSGIEIPTRIASSMVGELSSIVIFLRHIVRKKSFIVIEEPESHLHPAAIRLIANFIANLVRNKFTVLITTHTGLLLDQLNNLIISSPLKDKEKLGFSDVYLNSDEVAMYLFSSNKEGTGNETRQIELGEDGLIQDVFDEIMEELLDDRKKIEHNLYEKV